MKVSSFLFYLILNLYDLRRVAFFFITTRLAAIPLLSYHSSQHNSLRKLCGPVMIKVSKNVLVADLSVSCGSRPCVSAQPMASLDQTKTRLDSATRMVSRNSNPTSTTIFKFL